MSIFEVRKAHGKDAAGIGEVISAVWPESEVKVNRIENVIENTVHSTMVVSIDSVLAGFVDGFITTTVNGMRRWELDLLAVRPQYQRRGIAAALIEANTHEGQTKGAEMARGLVAVDNAGSQKSFERCGYVVHKTRYDLLVCGSRSHEPHNSNEQEKAYIIPVTTMNYTSLWIEGKLDLTSLVQGKRRLVETNYDLVGAVISENEDNLIHDALTIGYEKIGLYQWWQHPLIST